MTQLRLSIFVTLLVATLSVQAFPTLFGDTGLVLAPTADVQQEATFETVFDFLPMKLATGYSTSYPVRVCYGLATNTEIGVLYSEARDNAKGANVSGAAVKLALIPEGLYAELPGVGVGVRAYRENNRVMGELTGVESYVAISKILLMRGDNIENGFTLRLHTGVVYTAFSGANDATFIKPYLGISYMDASRSSLALEYLPAEKNGAVTFREATFSAALRRPLSPNFWINVGTTRAFGLGDTNMAFAGVMYRFGADTPSEEQHPQTY